MDTEINYIVDTISSILENNGNPEFEIILFGSRAKGIYSDDSDYDFMIITVNDLTFLEKRKIKFEVRKQLILNKRIVPLDILIKSKKQYNEEKDLIGNLAFDVSREGLKYVLRR
jgi:predicted nucleotidyltransferase